tara:strand:+ start:247 stop:822 length:576 start_codon:yes stop_codon:yes gene_type:complete
MKNLFLTIAALFAVDAKAEQNIQEAVFAGGCFWCVESDFEKVDGVVKAESGYTGGHVANPGYKQVSAGITGHIEAVKITYDANKVSYIDLVHKLFRTIDPTDGTGQFCDKGEQYRSAIFYANDKEKSIAEKAKQQTQEILKKKVYTDILPLKEFYLAEGYHQDYYKKNPIRYKFYRTRCGRDARVQEVWNM